MLRWTMLLAIIALLMAPAVMAQEPQPPQQPPQQPPRPSQPAQPSQQPKAEAEMAFTGEIVSVDADAKSITVKEVPPTGAGATPAPGAGKTMTLALDASTKITSKADTPATPPAAPGQAAGKTLEIKDLKAGDRVMIKYVSDAGKNKAKSIEVTKKPTS